MTVHFLYRDEASHYEKKKLETYHYSDALSERRYHRYFYKV
jgi:hypothetical protein